MGIVKGGPCIAADETAPGFAIGVGHVTQSVAGATGTPQQGPLRCFPGDLVPV
jgi:hypothetical protein